MNKDIMLGRKIQKVSESYYFDNLVSFIKGEANDCYAFPYLKPLYDEFGYKEVNDLIIEIAKEKEENKNE